MMMGAKWNPNLESYWASFTPFLHCLIINPKMTRNRFELITRCLHVTNPATVETNGDNLNYEKMRKIKWLVDELRGKSQISFNLEKMITVDEMM